jgi:hypothetical protein
MRNNPDSHTIKLITQIMLTALILELFLNSLLINTIIGVPNKQNRPCIALTLNERYISII